MRPAPNIIGDAIPERLAAYYDARRSGIASPMMLGAALIEYLARVVRPYSSG